MQMTIKEPDVKFSEPLNYVRLDSHTLVKPLISIKGVGPMTALFIYKAVPENHVGFDLFDFIENANESIITGVLPLRKRKVIDYVDFVGVMKTLYFASALDSLLPRFAGPWSK